MPKDILIEILLKVNKYEIYKIDIKDYGEFYVKTDSENQLQKIICESTEIRSAIIKLWKRYIVCNDMTIITNKINIDIIIWNYHRSGSVRLEEGWEEINIDTFDSITLQFFPQILELWNLQYDDISITKLNIIS